MTPPRIREGHRPRALVSIAALLVLVLALGAPRAPGATAAAKPAPTLRVAEGSSVFPARSLVLSVPGRTSVAPSEVHVSENGQPIPSAAVTPLAKAGADDFGIVLAIDISPSMKGRSLTNAMVAARALARRRVGNQQLGVIEFDQTPSTVLPLTSDGAAIERALRHTPATGPGTHIFDALAQSLAQLKAARVVAGAVILLSDGADRGSTQTETAVAAAARAAHVSLYTVGVRDAAFDPASLSALAHDGGGQFLATDSSRLRELFTRLEAGLVSRYIVHYHSRQAAGRQIYLQVRVDGVPSQATLSYLSPAPPRPAIARKAEDDSFWASKLALVVVSLTTALLIALAFIAFITPYVRRGTLRRRVREFTTPAVLASIEEHDEPRKNLLAPLESMLERAGWWARFKEEVEIARFDRAAVELVAICVGATVALSILLGAALRQPVLAVVALPLGPMALRSLVRHRLRKVRDLFAAQLPDHVQELASTMRAGHSLVSGITAMAKTASEPSRSEWTRVVADEQLGVPLETAMRPIGERMDCRDIEQIALVASLQHRSGGNMAEVLERVGDGVRERADLRRELVSLTAQARLSRWIVTALPPGMIGVLALLHPAYLRPLFQTAGGQLLVGVAVVLVVTGSLVMRAITNIKV
jgi:tight adherence protein B